MLPAILVSFSLALLCPLLHQRLGRGLRWLVAACMAGVTAYLAAHAPAIRDGRHAFQSFGWMDDLGIQLSFRLDGLSLLFALLITGIGTLIAIYAGSYLAGHRHLGRFYAYLVAFMASMLGVVLSDDLIALFVFWELTSLTSYLLIGFDHEKAESRSAALQALLVTGGGGLAMVAGFILLGQAGGTYSLSGLLAAGGTLHEDLRLGPALLLILAGAFTKSAQFPFHFWLPSAMAAPTPVSAYLHSSTMVKAGIYLLARMQPLFGATDWWTPALTVAGGLTMLVGGVLSAVQTDLKRLLAYSTVCILGSLTLLIGIASPAAVVAAVVLLVAHALYKSALFLGVGSLDHGTGTRDVRQLGGLLRLMPLTATAIMLAAVSNAGLPPLFGFLGKELVYEAAGAGPHAAWISAAVIVANVFLVAAAGIVGLDPFRGRHVSTPHEPHEGSPGLWAPPLLLAMTSLLLGVYPAWTETVLSPAVTAALGHTHEFHLHLWHGFNLPLLLSVITVAVGVVLYLQRCRLRDAAGRLRILERVSPGAMYEHTLAVLMRVAYAQTRLLQSGYLRVYLGVTILTTVALAGFALQKEPWPRADDAQWPAIHEWAFILFIAVATVMALVSRSRLAAVAALGMVGFCVATLFVLFSGPDLAITQLSIETLSVILLVLVLYRLPRFARFSSWPQRARQFAVALCGGCVMGALLWSATARPNDSAVTRFFLERSVPEGRGRNVVNVILVDFRAIDTLGEITVLTVAAIGVLALLKLRIREEDTP